MVSAEKGKRKSLPLKKKVPSEIRKGKEAKDNALRIAIGRETATLGTITEMSHEKTRSNMPCIRFQASVIT